MFQGYQNHEIASVGDLCEFAIDCMVILVYYWPMLILSIDGSIWLIWSIQKIRIGLINSSGTSDWSINPRNRSLRMLQGSWYGSSADETRWSGSLATGNGKGIKLKWSLSWNSVWCLGSWQVNRSSGWLFGQETLDVEQRFPVLIQFDAVVSLVKHP